MVQAEDYTAEEIVSLFAIDCAPDERLDDRLNAARHLHGCNESGRMRHCGTAKLTTALFRPEISAFPPIRISLHRNVSVLCVRGDQYTVTAAHFQIVVRSNNVLNRLSSKSLNIVQVPSAQLPATPMPR